MAPPRRRAGGAASYVHVHTVNYSSLVPRPFFAGEEKRFFLPRKKWPGIISMGLGRQAWLI